MKAGIFAVCSSCLDANLSGVVDLKLICMTLVEKARPLCTLRLIISNAIVVSTGNRVGGEIAKEK